MKKYTCALCSHSYDEVEGDPGSGIAPGTKWEDVPDEWMCPDCGAGKEDYFEVE
jgi:rubredoxin-NAD+ reductase